MFNKIVASVISSVVLFACNVKEETPVAAEDVVASPSAAEVVQTAVTPAPVDPVTPAPVVQSVTDVASVPVAGGAVVPSGVPASAPVAGSIAVTLTEFPIATNST